MVNHLTRVLLREDGTPGRAARVASMGETLQGAGFTLREERRRLLAESSTVEAAAAKALLRRAGFRDPEFQIVLEYARAWGIL